MQPTPTALTQMQGDKIRSEQVYHDRQTMDEQLGLKATKAQTPDLPDPSATHHSLNPQKQAMRIRVFLALAGLAPSACVPQAARCRSTRS
jgi:hypothetical protein